MREASPEGAKKMYLFAAPGELFGVVAFKASQVYNRLQIVDRESLSVHERKARGGS